MGKTKPIIVGIGASAGGLAALKRFFANVPEQTGLSFIVVMHLSPEHESHLADLLQPYCRLPVQQVTESVALEPDSVYVIPPGRNLNAVDTHLRLSPLEERRRERAPIDHFFRTLASTHDGDSVGVILTGTGSDGTLGIKDIKDNGGLTVVQDPNEAEFDGMPQSAISTHLVDLVLPLDQMPGEILRCVQTRPRLAMPNEGEAVDETQQHALGKILAQVPAGTGRDFSRYEELATVNQENRHRVEELSQFSSDLQNLLSATDIAAIFLDCEIRILRFTPQVGVLFNIRTADRGRPLSDLTHRLDYDQLIDDTRQVLENLIPIDREARDNEGRWYLTRVRPYRSTDDRIGGVVITFLDITERKNSELSLRESEERFRLLVDTSAQIVWSTAANGEVDEDSPSWRVYTGQTFEQFKGTGWTHAIAPEDRDRALAQWKNAVSTGEPLHTEFRVFHAESGEYRWTEVRAGALRDPDGTIHGWVGMNIDIHEHKLAEQSIKEINETLEARVEERTLQVRQLASKLTMAEQEERRRVSQILHDNLQQLLYGLQMKIRMLEEQLEAAGQQQLTDAVAETRSWLQEAIETTRQLTVDLSPPILKNEGLADALGWLKRQMQQLHGLEVELKTINPPYTANENLRVLLFQVVRELLFNIKKHAEVNRALVELDQVDERIRIRVSDSGKGFEPSMMEEGHGSGFGLVSVRERLRLLGGDMEIDSAPGNGTTMLIWIPATPTW